MSRVIADLTENDNVRLVQRLFYDVFCGYYYIISVRTQSGHTFLHLDCLYDPWGINRYHLRTSYLLQNRIQTVYGYRCSQAREAEYLLVKRIVKISWTASKFKEIQRLFDSVDSDRQDIIQKWLGPKGAELFSQFIRSEHDSIDQTVGCKLKQRLELRFAIYNFIWWFSRHMLTLTRNLVRTLRPNGFFVVIIGPDGAGKSTINTSIQNVLSRGFRNIWHFHWRPKLLPKLGPTMPSNNKNESVAPPPKQSHYKGVVSLIRFLYYWMDFVFGYWLIIYPKRARATFVIGERYFPDVIVHPERYGFSVPEWFMRLAAAAVPSADMIILLKDTPEAIFNRKSELSVNMIRSQILSYEKEISHWHAPNIVHTSGGVTETSDTIVSLIVEACHQRIYS